MKKNKHIIKMVQPGSIAEELEIEPGDELISINDQKIEDVFDYHYLVNDDYLTVLIRKTNGMNIVPAETTVFSVLSIRCRRGCGKLCILKTMIPVFLFCRVIM